MLFWVFMVPIGGFAAGQTSDRLTLDFSLPGQPGYQTEKQILATYANGGSNPPTIAVVTVPEGTTVDEQLSKITPVFDAVKAALPKTRFVDYAETKDPVFLTDDKRTTYALVYPEEFKSFTDVGPDVAMKPILEKAARTPASTSASRATTCSPRGPMTRRHRACSLRSCSVLSVRSRCWCSSSPRSSPSCR